MTWWHYLLGAVLFAAFLWWLSWAIRRHEREAEFRLGPNVGGNRLAPTQEQR